ncbi:hypothetical protein [Streptomyces sp. NPDC001851]|uniref:hypothetical protein n=1 Tax=Streptomyces sp. NPDC001851 TaxID=3154529 RepID=UPI003318E447
MQELDRPYSKEREDLKRELSALLDQDLTTRRHQPIPPPLLPPGAPGDGHLDDLVRQVRQWQPGQQGVTVARLLHASLTGLTEEGRKELLTGLADAVRAFGDDGTAQHLAFPPGETS